MGTLIQNLQAHTSRHLELIHAVELAVIGHRWDETSKILPLMLDEFVAMVTNLQGIDPELTKSLWEKFIEIGEVGQRILRAAEPGAEPVVEGQVSDEPSIPTHREEANDDGRAKETTE